VSRGRRIFILGGGASLGAHQVGALRRLEEEGIRPDAIVASSIGVINACLYASGGVETLERAWREIGSILTTFRPSLRHNPLLGLSFFSSEPLARRIDAYLDYERILSSPLELSFVLLNLSRGEGQFVSNRQARSPRDLATLVRAGWALPVIFPPVRFRGEYFVDGGFAWNVPLLQAVEMGASEIYLLAVVTPHLPFQRAFRGLPDYLTRLGDVLWRTLANVGFLTTRIEPDGTYRGVPVTVIHPTEELAGFSLRALLSSSPARNRRLVSAGYRDAKRELERLRRTSARRSRVAEGVAEVEPAFRHEVA
jgi:predicted acylesterase/phospholipase RssA